MLRRFLFVLIVLTFILIGGCYWILRSPLFVEKIATNIIKKNLKEYTLDEFSIGSQQFFYPGQLIFSKILLRLHSKDDHYRIAIGQLRCDRLNTLLTTDALLQFSVPDITLESNQIQAKTGNINGSVYFYGWNLEHFEGKLMIPQLTAYQHQLTNLNSNFSGDTKHIEFRHLQADVYKGKIFSRILLDWGKDVPYSIRARLKNIDLSAMKEVNPSIYGQVEGIVNATASLQGTTRNFNTLKFQATVAKDGRVNASLLQFVTPYIPRTQESVGLNDLIKKGLKVPVEVASFEIRSIDQHKLSGIAKFAIKQLNLDLNLPIDILYDGNFYSLIQWIRKIGT